MGIFNITNSKYNLATFSLFSDALVTVTITFNSSHRSQQFTLNPSEEYEIELPLDISITTSITPQIDEVYLRRITVPSQNYYFYQGGQSKTLTVTTGIYNDLLINGSLSLSGKPRIIVVSN